MVSIRKKPRFGTAIIVLFIDLFRGSLRRSKAVFQPGGVLSQIIQERSSEMKKSGFTLIELMIVIAIIAILASIIMPKFTQGRVNSKATACKANLRHLGITMELYANANSHNYASSLSALTPDYTRALPVCPVAGAAYGFTKAANCYTLYCNTSGNPHATAGCGNTGYPQFSSAGGLKNK